jgi:hypothetical protein
LEKESSRGITVACVLRGGGIYNAGHVQKLRDMCEVHLPAHRFVCLSDLNPDCEVIPLTDRWPGWWSKLELFKLPGPVLFFDLDTVITGSMDEIIDAARGHEFVILRDVYRGEYNPKAMQSSVMFWSGDMSRIYKQYAAGPVWLDGGDQAYLEQVVQNATYWQDITDGIVSYKVDVQNRGLQPHHKCVIFHGTPRPWEQKDVDY